MKEYKNIGFSENKEKVVPKYRAIIKLQGQVVAIYSSDLILFEALEKLVQYKNI